MARTKQTARASTGGKASRKQLAIHGRKRKNPENDESDGTDKKRQKLNPNQDISDEDESDELNDCIEEQNQDKDKDDKEIQIKMDNALQSVSSIFHSNCSISQLLTFSNKLNSITTETKTKLEELTYRQKALSLFCSRYQERMKGVGFYSHRHRERKQYFNKKILHFFKTTVKGLRFCNMKKTEDWDYGHTMHFNEYSLDIALKAIYPHQQYINMMHDLLKGYIDDITDITQIISQYNHNGYRWYRLEFIQQTDDDGECWDALNQTIFYNLEFDVDDYFKNNKYYKKKKPESVGCVSFKSLRDELKCKGIAKMSNNDLACFIIAVTMIELSSDLLEESQDWIIEHHL